MTITFSATYRCATAGKIKATHIVNLDSGKDQNGAVVGGIPSQYLRQMSTEQLLARRAQLIAECRKQHFEIQAASRWRRGDMRPWYNKLRNEYLRINTILSKMESQNV